MLAHSFLIKSSSKLLVTRTSIKARMSLISGLWFPWPIYMFLKWDLTLAHWTQVSDRCPLGYLFFLNFNLAYEFLSMPVCVCPKNSGPSTNMAERQSSLKSLIVHYSTLTTSLSHLLRGHWSDFFKTFPRCSPNGLVVHARKWFWSVDTYGRWQSSLIFTVVASPKPLDEFFRNLAYEFLSVSKYVCLKMILVG